MAIDNHTFAALPIYDSIEKQVHRKEWLHNDVCTAPLISSKNRLLPFQIKRQSRYNTIASIKLFCFNDTEIEDIYTTIETKDITIVTSSENMDYITYFANYDLTEDLPCGKYYLKITDSIDIWYSEIFEVKNFTWGLTKVISTSSTWQPRPFSIRSESLIAFNQSYIKPF